MEITNMSEEHLEECTDLLIDVFTTPPPGMIHTAPGSK